MSSESGRASLEFLVAAVFFLIPVMLLGLSVSSIQNASLAAESAARAAVSIFVGETSEYVASHKAERAVQVALANFGIDEPLSLERRCIPSACLSPGALVTIRVGVEAPLFGVGFLSAITDGSVSQYAEGSAIVSPYGGAP